MIGWLEAGAETVICSVIWGSKFAGAFGIRTRIARAIFDFVEDAPLALCRLKCFIFLSPFWLRVNSFARLAILASVDFSRRQRPRLLM